jgi:hypothetical protein
MTPQQAYMNLTRKFTSSNSIPVERSSITAEEFEPLAKFIDAFKENLVLVDMGLSFSLCNYDHDATRRDVKKVQEDFQKMKDAWEGK